MSTIVHHQTLNEGLSWNLHAWTNTSTGTHAWDRDGTTNGPRVDFPLPEIADLRKLQFKYNNVNPATNAVAWEADSFNRRLWMMPSGEIWTFEFSARIAYTNPFPVDAQFKVGDVVTVNAITQKQFRGGRVHVWNPYLPGTASVQFPETARHDATNTSTFQVTLTEWMLHGFHFKLMSPKTSPNGSDVWESDAAIRVWRPGDRTTVWIKSGEPDVRSEPLVLTPFRVEVLYPALLENPPTLALLDVAEQVDDIPAVNSESTPYPADPLFKVASYTAQIYPGANYNLYSKNGVERTRLDRPFPADPIADDGVSRFVLGASAWIEAFPITAPASLIIQPLGASSFAQGVTVQLGFGNAQAYQAVAATRRPDGTYCAQVTVALNTKTFVQLVPTIGQEPKLYDGLDTGRYFTPVAPGETYFTTEGVYGICRRGPTLFADPPDRGALMRAAFGDAVVGASVFDTHEMPLGATLLNGDVYFVVHAPHSVSSVLILVNENAPAGPPERIQIPMKLTHDRYYWWSQVPATQAHVGARYHFLLNDDIEVLDPAARAVQDCGQTFAANLNDDPGKDDTSWSMVVDVARVYAAAHRSPWQTMGWHKLLIYEIHANRFSDLRPPNLLPLDFLADELSPINQRGQPGYLHQLPVTTFGLMPVSEFHNQLSWGYDPSYYFAIDSFYGGAVSLANFVNTAHANGRAVMLDVVYNHSLGSSLIQIAPEVYRNGDYDGDRMNCGHPMVNEFFRQATLYLWRTFGLDGFRFDDTKTIITQCQGGWDFLRMLRHALRVAADAEGRAWPYCVAENSDNPWAVSDPHNGVLDGQWGIDESYRILDASYDSWPDSLDNSGALANEMNQPAYLGRPFSQATRFGESHDMVSAQNPVCKRIAARRPFGQGFQLAKAMGTLTLLSNGVPMLFMGQEVGETLPFSFDEAAQPVNPQRFAVDKAADQARILSWFHSLMGLRNDETKGLQGNDNYQVVGKGNRTVSYSCGSGQRLFVIVTFGTPNQQQNSAWLGLTGDGPFKEIFNSSWPVFQVSSEPEFTNGGYDARIHSGQILNLPAIGAVVLERA